MADTTTKEQVIEGTLKGMDEIYQPTPGSAFLYHEVREYVRRRLERAYELGYYHGWTNERKMKKEESKCDGVCEQCPEDGGKNQCEMWR